MTTGLRNVLMIAYDFPPCRSPGAAVRTAKFVRYLPEFGWSPTVLCRDDLPEAREARDEHVVAVPAGLPEAWSYQAAAWRWAARVESVARKLLAESTFDVLYATGPPFPPIVTAARITANRSLPLVVDFRDAWSQDPFEGGSWPKRLAKRGLRRWAYASLERRVLEASHAVVTNTPSMAEALDRGLFARRAIREMLPNGFDEADFSEPLAAAEPSDEVVFLHCGRFSGIAGRSPEPLLRALGIAARGGRRIALRVLGDASPYLSARARRLGVERLVRLEPPVPHELALREVRRADVLVLYQAPGRGPVTPVAGKTFEYVRSGRPVLAIVPPGDNSTVVRRYARDVQLVSSSDPEAIAAAMSELADGHPHPTREPGPDFARYDRRAITSRLAEIFDRVAPVPHDRPRGGATP